MVDWSRYSLRAENAIDGSVTFNSIVVEERDSFNANRNPLAHATIESLHECAVNRSQVAHCPAPGSWITVFFT